MSGQDEAIHKILRKETMQAQQECDLPDYLATRIYVIADHLQKPRPVVADIEKLIEQLRLYDTYGQTGYLGMGVNHLILEKTIEAVEMQLGLDSTHSRS